MIKKLIIGAGLLVALPLFIFGTSAMSYLTTARDSVREAVKREVKPEWEVKRVKGLVDNLVPDIQKCMRVIAEQQVDIEHLQGEIVRREDALADQEKILLSMTKDLESGDEEIQYVNRTYTSEEVRRDLSHRFDKFKVAKDALERDRKILKAREKALAANQEKLENMISKKQDLEVQIAELEARLKSIEAQETISELNFDDSQLAQAKSAIRDLNKSLDVKERMLDVEGRFANLIPTEDVRKVPEDLTAQIQEYLNRSDESEPEELPVSAPLVLRAESE
jgi:hypothetical protein